MTDVILTEDEHITLLKARIEHDSLCAEVERLRRANSNNLEGWAQNVAGLQREIVTLQTKIRQLQKALSSIAAGVDVRIAGDPNAEYNVKATVGFLQGIALEALRNEKNENG